MGKHSKEIRIGIFAVLILAATFIVLNILRGSDIFGREIEVNGRFDNVEGLVASAPVLIRGYAAGRVSAVEYDTEKDNFLVICAIDKRFKIPVDSYMKIYSTSIMGGKGIRIDPGISTEYVQDGGDILTGSDPDLLSSLSKSIVPVIESLNDLIDSLKMISNNVNHIIGEGNRKSINESLVHLKRTLASASELMNTLESDYSAKSDEIGRIVENLEALSDKLGPLADSAKSAIDSTGETVDTLKNSIVDINNNVDKISKPLNTLLVDIDKLVLEVKENPKKYIKISVF